MIEVLDGVKVMVTRRMGRLEAEIYGVSVMVEAEPSGPGTCEFLFTTQAASQINSPFTVLQNDDIIKEKNESALTALPSGRYVFPDGKGLYLDVSRDGRASFRKH